MPQNHAARPPVRAPQPPPVAVLRWPEQDAERRRLAGLGLPRVVLTAADVVPPTLLDDRELWLRDGSDLTTVAEAVERLSHEAGTASGRPLFDDDRWLRHDGRSVRIPPRDVAVVAMLVRRFGRIVSRGEVVSTYSGTRPEVSRAAVSALAKRVDTRAAAVGLRVYSLRHRGFMLAAMGSDQGERAVDFT